MKQILSLILSFVLSIPVFSQKVGLVLSGGGAHGLAHIGALKALEENNIPIDYIVGTSMGAIVGGFYAAGYSPYEIEYIAETEDFQEWVSGNFTSKFKHFFQKKEPNASIGSVRLGLDSSFQTSIKANIINDIPLNFALQQLLAQASANAQYNFDSLFIPFRAMVSDVLSQKSIALHNGSLNDALRATLTVPYVYRPIRIDGKYMFDGGLYNNFPVNIMKDQFQPDVLIGVNVSTKVYNEYPFEKDDALLNRLFILMFLSKSDSTLLTQKDIYIEPAIDEYSPIDFSKVKFYIHQGYQATLKQLPEIKEKIKRNENQKILNQKRKLFLSKQPPLIINKIEILGVNKNQEEYIRRIFTSKKNKEFSLEEIKNGYYKLVADDNFQSVYPKILFDSLENSYTFQLIIRPERLLKFEFGGSISSKPINGAYAGIQYNFLRKKSYTFSADFDLGRFNESVKLKGRIDVPTQLPYFIEADFTFNNWDYFKSSQLFLEKITPTFLEQTDRSFSFLGGIPIGNNSKLIGKISLVNLVDEYSQNNKFQSGDTLDKTIYNCINYKISIENNSLDDKQFPTSGKYSNLFFQYINGIETYFPGSTSLLIIPQLNKIQWFRLYYETEQYVKIFRKYSIGIKSTLTYSNQPFFTTYRSSIIRSTPFYPMFDTKTLFIESFRSNQFGSFGIVNIAKISKNFNLRSEAHVFQPIYEIIEGENQNPMLGPFLNKQYYYFATGLTYKTPIFPVSFFVNYNSAQDINKFGFLFNVGYLIFNKRALD